MLGEPNLLGVIGDELAAELDAQLHALDRTGWSGLEVRSVGGRMLVDLDEGEFTHLAARINTSGAKVLAIDSNIGGWTRSITSDFAIDLRELERLAPRAFALGTTRIRIMSWQNQRLSQADWRSKALARIAAISRHAKRLGVHLLHENCAGWGGQGPEQALDLLEHADRDALSLLFDTGNGLTYGYDAPDYLAPIAHAVAHVHIKDGRRLGRGGVFYTPAGTGSAQVPRCIAILRDAGYHGPWVLEPHFLVAPHEGRLKARADPSHAALTAASALGDLLAGAQIAQSVGAQP